MSSTASGTRRAVGGLAVLVAVALGGCNAGTQGTGSPEATAPGSSVASAAPNVETVKIALIGALTGDYKTIVVPAYQAAGLAFEQANNGSLPVRFELVGMDTGGNADQAVPLADQIINDEAFVGIIGPAFSSETQAIGPRLDQAGIPAISQSATNPGLSQNGWTHWFRAIISDAVGGPIIAKYLEKNAKPNCVFMTGDGTSGNTSWLVSVGNQLETDGVTVMPRENFVSGQRDFSALVSKVAATGCNTIFAASYSIDVGPIRKQLDDAGLQSVTMIGTEAFKDDQFIELAGESAEGTVTVCSCADINSSDAPEAKAFVEAYTAKYGEAPGIYAAEAWDIAQMYIAAATAGSTTRADITSFLHNMKGVKGITKTFAFDETGELVSSSAVAYFFEVKDGAWVLLGPAGLE
jgi:branched-chain amino acid transport system substrate-binding protein